MVNTVRSHLTASQKPPSIEPVLVVASADIRTAINWIAKQVSAPFQSCSGIVDFLLMLLSDQISQLADRLIGRK